MIALNIAIVVCTLIYHILALIIILYNYGLVVLSFARVLFRRTPATSIQMLGSLRSMTTPRMMPIGSSATTLRKRTRGAILSKQKIAKQIPMGKRVGYR